MGDADLASLFEALDVQRIRQLVVDRQEEHLGLEFKTLGAPPFSGRDDRKNLAVALSGFANSAGGIVLWGIRTAREGSDAPDVADGEVPVSSLILGLSRLNEFTASGVRPIVDGVRHRAIHVEGDVGFLVTLVPESATGPHMAKAGEDRYYKRSGDSFVRMEHFDIADMFGRRAGPVLGLNHTVVRRGSSRGGGSATNNGAVVLSITNSGRGSALAPFLMFDVESDHVIARRGLSGRGEGLPRLPHSEGPKHHQFGGDATTVIHPGTERDVAAIDVRISRSGGRISHSSDLRLNYALAADGFPRRDGYLVVRGDEIAEELGVPDI